MHHRVGHVQRLVYPSILTVCLFLQWKDNESQRVAAERGIKGAQVSELLSGVKLFNLLPFAFAATLFS